MKTVKKLIAFTAALLTAAALPCSSSADNMIVEIIPETKDAEIIISPDDERTKISPYIYGINDKGDISGISPTVIKQTGTELTTYNWETNFSNAGAKGMNANDVSLVDNFPSRKWSSPALYTDSLYSRSLMNNIPVRLVTLQMMGYVAKDSMGIVSSDELSKNTRWCTVRFNKNDTFLNQPDTEDNEVYIDEYVSYLVNRYGSAADGGINGYFLDSEPDLWADNFSILGLAKTTPEELVELSASLASTVKTIDSKAFVFGPSVSGLQGCINLNNPDAWNVRTRSENEYSWFIDYYLSEMRKRGEGLGYRLLDVLDLHYYTEATTPLGAPVLTTDDEYSNAFRMQAVKTLWDPNYTENSVTVLMNKQFTPIIPTLQASIRINYPGTRLSFSEYDFGGGGDISGAIAQADVLGTFAREGVYLACLSPTSDDYSFQKAAMRLYTNYDGNGTGFGNMMIAADNDGDSMSSVFAASDSENPEKLRIIVTNKNMVNLKNFSININSDKYSYELAEAYTIDKDSADIISADVDMFNTDEDGFISFEADTTSIYMLVLNGSTAEQKESENPSSVWETDPSQTESDIISAENTETASETSSSEAEQATESSEVNPADETVPDLIETEVTTVTETTTENAVQTGSVSDSSSESTAASDTSIEDDSDRTVSTPIKVIVSILASTVGLCVIYILIFDKK